ncbi:MAG: Mbeg1-like protein [Oscillibacter sp.]|nr:Mbeg1-like protein [Oscillibacter sp.]
MANLMDYLDWRADLTFLQAPFNEVDNLILAELAFVDLHGIVPGIGEGAGVALKDAAARYFADGRDKVLESSVLVPALIPDMLEKMCTSARFGDLILSCHEEHLDEVHAEQFAAITVELPGRAAYISFRGTDDTLVGWKEDFDMALLDTVPSQLRAADYVKRAAARYKGWKLYLGGHSKGGNLAVYSAVNCGKAVQNRLVAVYNNDGPGFRKTLMSREEHRRVADRIFTILPKSSVVGLLMEHEEAFVVVDSTQVGVLQHDGFSWCVRGPEFVRMHDLTGVETNDKALKEWVNSLDQEQREKFSDALFKVMSASGAETLAEMRSQGTKSAAAMLKAMVELDKDTRAALNYAIGVLFIKSGAQSLLDDWKRERRHRRKKREERKESGGE